MLEDIRLGKGPVNALEMSHGSAQLTLQPDLPAGAAFLSGLRDALVLTLAVPYGATMNTGAGDTGMPRQARERRCTRWLHGGGCRYRSSPQQIYGWDHPRWHGTEVTPRDADGY